MFVFELIKAIFLGIIEGITEWLPVSSTGHIILFDEFFPLTVGKDVHPDFVLEFMSMFEVVIQMGAIMAVVVLFWNKLWPFSRNKTTDEKRAVWHTWFKVCIASICRKRQEDAPLKKRPETGIVEKTSRTEGCP